MWQWAQTQTHFIPNYRSLTVGRRYGPSQRSSVNALASITYSTIEYNTTLLMSDICLVKKKTNHIATCQRRERQSRLETIKVCPAGLGHNSFLRQAFCINRKLDPTPTLHPLQTQCPSATSSRSSSLHVTACWARYRMPTSLLPKIWKGEGLRVVGGRDNSCRTFVCGLITFVMALSPIDPRVM